MPISLLLPKLSDAQLRESLKPVVAELVDPDTLEMLAEHHERGRTLEELSLRFEVCISSVCHRMTRARVKLRRLKLLPAHWEPEP